MDHGIAATHWGVAAILFCRMGGRPGREAGGFAGSPRCHDEATDSRRGPVRPSRPPPSHAIDPWLRHPRSRWHGGDTTADRWPRPMPPSWTSGRSHSRATPTGRVRGAPDVRSGEMRHAAVNRPRDVRIRATIPGFAADPHTQRRYGAVTCFCSRGRTQGWRATPPLRRRASCAPYPRPYPGPLFPSCATRSPQRSLPF